MLFEDMGKLSTFSRMNKVAVEEAPKKVLTASLLTANISSSKWRRQEVIRRYESTPISFD